MRPDRKSRRRVLIAGVTAGASALAVAVVATSPAAAAPIEGQIRNANQSTSVTGGYIVKFKEASINSANVSTKANELATRFGGKLGHTYKAVGGFSVSLSEAQAKKLAADPSVEYVEQDMVVKALDTQTNPTWGLDRIDQANLPVDNKYTYPSTAGAGITAYVIDTGIYTANNEFGGRATSGYDYIDNDSNSDDCNGHGTHVAGTIGGKTYGVAKQVKLVGVRVLDCSGYSKGSSVTAGLDWVALNAKKPAVANMSLGGSASSALDDATKKVINAGVIMGVAAGNNNGDACQTSPARTPEAITVAASDSADKRSIYGGTQASNWGSCTDIFGPGSNITSAWIGGVDRTNSIGGTSMATPHVVGAAALYLGTAGNSAKTQAEVAKALTDNATLNKITDPRGSANKLLNISFLNGPSEPVCAPAGSTEDKAIPDAGAAVSTSATVSNCSGAGTGTTSVKVDIVHSYSADLKVELVSPSGKVFQLQAPRGVGSATGIHQTFTADTSSESAKNGAWKLQVTDTIAYDTGNIDGWNLSF